MNTVLPQPTTDDNHTARQCSKCGGTGFFCQGTLDGRPISNTGFDCWACNGTGWKIIKKRTKKETCPVCGWRVEIGKPHHFTRELPDGTWGPVECNPEREGLSELV